MATLTASERRAYIKSLDDLAKRFDNLDDQTIKRLIELLQETRRNLSDLLQTGPSDFEQARLTQLRNNIDLVIADFNRQLTISLNQSFNGSFETGAASVVEPLAQLGLTGQFNIIAPAQLNIAADFSAALVQDISDDMRSKINGALRLSQLGQETPFQAMRRVTDILGVKARDGRWGRLNRPEVVRGVAARAEAIVRTETTRMYNLGHNSQQQILAQSVPGLKKRWMATGDRRTRRTHLSVHRQTFSDPIPIAQPFHVNGSFLLYPGDPRAPAKETVNCRCRVITVHPELGVIPTPEDSRLDDESQKREPLDVLGPPAGATRQTPVIPVSTIPEPSPPIPASPPEPRRFPDELTQTTVVRPLGGSTGAELVEDVDTGKLFVKKKGGSPEHLREEITADRAYQALGVNVPDFKVYDTPSGPIKLAEFIEGETLANVLKSGKLKRIQSAFKQIQKDFASDALLGNWDVIGLDKDNILVDKKGKVWRIDNGGALRYRAQGRLKSTLGKAAEFDAYPNEFWTLRDMKINPDAAFVYDGMPFDEILKQMRSVGRKRKKVLEALPDDLKPIIESRLDTVKDVVKVSKTLNDDAFGFDYIDGFTKHSVGIRKAGVIDNLPQRLKNRGVQIRDENDLDWDHLRGRDSIMHEVRDYINQNGGEYNIITFWMNAQAGSSWSGASQAFKYFIAQQRGGEFDKYYWHEGVDKAKQHFESVTNLKGAKYTESFKAWHAWNYEMIRNAKFARNKRDFVELVRTEPSFVLSQYGVKRGDKNVQMLRGGVESSSIYQTVVVNGDQLTIQKVPHHRIIGNYFYERNPGFGDSPFYGDKENEFVFIPEGIPFDYIGTVGAGENTSKFWK